MYAKVYFLTRVHTATYCRSLNNHFLLFIQTDKTGCGSRVIHVTEFDISFNGYFEVTCNVEETGTGECKTNGCCPFLFSKME